MQVGGIVLFGERQNVFIQLFFEWVVMVNRIQIGLNHELYHRIREMGNNILVTPMVGSCEFSQCVQIVLAGGILDMSDQLGGFTHKLVSAVHQIPGGPHAGGIHVGQGVFPPRSNRAILRESLRSFLDLVPFMSFMYRA